LENVHNQACHGGGPLSGDAPQILEQVLQRDDRGATHGHSMFIILFA
jgi:hypothetical protein